MIEHTKESVSVFYHSHMSTWYVNFDEDTVRRAFNYYDLNQTGRLDWDEIRHLTGFLW